MAARGHVARTLAVTERRRTEREIARDLRLARAERGVATLRRAALAAEQEFGAELDAMPAAMRESAYNLVHYLAVRRLDVRELQEELARLGLSSLGRMEAHVMAALEAVLAALRTLRRQPVGRDLAEAPRVTFETGPALLAEHANAMLGTTPPGRATRIMVTMPGEAADDPKLIRDLVDAGMQIMRVNCAHDSAPVWERMVRHLRRAERATGKRCLVSFDLAGPKIRTGPMALGPRVAKWRPVRDDLGRVQLAARVRLVTAGARSAPGEIALPVAGPLVAKARPGDTVTFVDTRERNRTLRVETVCHGECACTSETTAYVIPGIALTLRRKGRSVAKGKVGHRARRGARARRRA
jgi:pyruvate kinase